MGSKAMTPAELDEIVAEFVSSTRTEIYDSALSEYPTRMVVLFSESDDDGRRTASMVLFDGPPPTAEEQRFIVMNIGQQTANEGKGVEAVIWSEMSGSTVSVTGMLMDGSTCLTTFPLTQDEGGGLVPGDARVSSRTGGDARSMLTGAFALGYLAASIPPLWAEPADGLDGLLSRMPIPGYVSNPDKSSPGRVTFKWMDLRLVLESDGTVREITTDGKEVESALATFSETFIGGKR